MQMSTLRNVCLAAILSASLAPAGWSDEVTPEEAAATQDAGAEAETLAPSDEALSETAALIGHARLSAETLRDAARRILSGEGNRKTDETRRLVAGWANTMSYKLTNGLKALAASEANVLKAEAKQLKKLEKERGQIRDAIVDMEANLKVLKASQQPRAVDMEIENFEKALDELRMAIADVDATRTATLEFGFAEPLDQPAYNVVMGRVTTLVESHNITLIAPEEDYGVRLLLKGAVPADMGSDEVRNLIPQLFAPVDAAAEGEPAGQVTELPQPDFIAIELD